MPGIRIHSVHLLGLGGIGSHLAEPLVRLLAHHPNGTRDVTFIDGDSYEEKNATRQLFDHRLIGNNKALATAEKMPFVEIRSIAAFADENLLLDELMAAESRATRNGVSPEEWTPLIITAVDNMATRKMVAELLGQMMVNNFVWMDPGNEYDTAMCYTWVKYRGKVVNASPMELFSNMRNPSDRIPGGCSYETPSFPQLIVANATASLITLLCLNSLLDGHPWFDHVSADCKKNILVPSTDPTPPLAQEKELVKVAD